MPLVNPTLSADPPHYHVTGNLFIQVYPWNHKYTPREYPRGMVVLIRKTWGQSRVAIARENIAAVIADLQAAEAALLEP